MGILIEVTSYWNGQRVDLRISFVDRFKCSRKTLKQWQNRAHEVYGACKIRRGCNIRKQGDIAVGIDKRALV